MTVAEQAKQILDLSELNLPAKPKIIAVKIEEFVAYDGDDALRIYAILDEATTDQDMTGESVLQIKGAIHDALYQAGIEHFPYVQFWKQSEADQYDEEEIARDA